MRASLGISLEFSFVGIVEFMCKQIVSTRGFCLSSAPRRALFCGFVKASSRCTCAFLFCVSDAFSRGVLALVIRRC